MIGIIDYGMANLHSVESACKKLGLECVISHDKAILKDCDKLILPGVGAFGDMDRALRNSGLFEWIQEQVLQEEKPLLGICLGMQALFEESFEFGHYQGLGFMDGKVKAMQPLKLFEKGRSWTLNVPQIGWNELIVNLDFPLYPELSNDPYVYFDHSYVVEEWNPADLIAYAQYGPYCVPAICMRKNVIGCQFHPEKSGNTGLRILEWFGKEFGA